MSKKTYKIVNNGKGTRIQEVPPNEENATISDINTAIANIKASTIPNDSLVTGESIDDALNTLKTQIDGVNGVPYLGSIVPTSVPTGTGAATWTATQAGTYTNFGGVVVNANSFAIISRNDSNIFSISQTLLDLSTYATVAYVNQQNLLDKTYQTKRTIFDTILGSYINNSGAVTVGVNFNVKKYAVTAGESIKINGNVIGSIMVWCFYNSSNFIVGNVIQTGQIISTQTNINTILTVPAGATYIGVTKVLTGNRDIDVYNINNVDVDLTNTNNRVTTTELNQEIFLNTITPINTITGFYIGGVGTLISSASFQVKVYDTQGLSKVRVAGKVNGNIMQYCWYSDASCTTVVLTGTNSSGLVDVNTVLETRARYLGVTDSSLVTLEMGAYSISNLANTIYNLDTSINSTSNTIKYISADGDSLTAGAGTSNGITYLTTLVGLLGANYIGRNLGVGGENTLTIGARVNAIQAKTKNNFTIPATTTPIDIGIPGNTGLISSWDDTTGIAPLVQGSGSMNPVVISDIPCTLTYTGTKYTLTRVTAGTAKSIIAGTPVYCNAGKITRADDFKIIYIGTNGTYSTPDELILQIQAYLDYYQTTKYIIIGLHYRGGRLGNDSIYDLPMQKKFGAKYFNNRKYLSTYGIIDAINLGYLPNDGTYPTAQDTLDMDSGYPPLVLRADEVHYNVIGYQLMGNKLYEIGKNLGYW